MQSIPLYSLVIFPNEAQKLLIKDYKQLLKTRIGWFGSANAAAHITVVNFENDIALALHIDQIREYCKNSTPQIITFNSWDSFGEKTFFIAPDEQSKTYLNTLISNLHHNLGFKNTTVNAHLTIARGLDHERMNTAKSTFYVIDVNFEFDCDAIFVRKFNHHTKQYTDIIEKILFEG